ncbi:2-amino-4-hydroxy-6-hydroxymethyldihydropteridine diphosphokinase [Chitinibacter fontanus]|uniref:2-amino-4-hydroxy-6-hydroxymethyldihydropteridine pyrophosphokinase n=1 Tax=Chitinibacter fontanus TaxID=1737446 RepID=A0A7D5ZGG1_9NEIS|nr:2-amino-4-hydroxy-6-hydroxymethyldihydropteridine diphosphokinase [Chitinibacter fontanus]QLI82048.1 2-amino-4-hydroxy-6-hydroxymethyldihydropteridine diphosphokinase [Chitinibacter fontanus]
MTIAYIALGANLGDPSAQLRDALRLIAELPRTQLLASSSFYASAPVGYADQPDFVNAVCAVNTELSAPDLLAALLALELQQGRERSFKNAPRTLDLDVVLYGDEIIELPQLQIPHPRMHQRAFVLLPLLEIAPDAQIPGRGAATQFIADVIDQELYRIEA